MCQNNEQSHRGRNADNYVRVRQRASLVDENKMTALTTTTFVIATLTNRKNERHDYLQWRI